jgi:AraC-like DNA-binding protein
MTDPDRIVFQSALVTVGAFRCPVNHPAFRDSGPIRESCVVFPRTSVVIEHEGARGFVSDAGLATMYNRGQRYERRPVSPEGDRCDYFAVRADVVREVVASIDPAAGEHAERPIQHPHAPIPHAMYLEQRRIFARLRAAQGRREAVDSIEVEERVLSLVSRAIRGASVRDVGGSGSGRRRRGSRTAGPRALRQRQAIADAARALIGRRFRERLDLATIAREIGSSSFHLARSFHEVTGTTVHAHITVLRLRAALEYLALEPRAGRTGPRAFAMEPRVFRPGDSLAFVALEVGFSSHSHFTAAFRRAFGVTPSRARS